MRPRTNFQLARIFGIRIGVSASWFFVLFFLIYYLSDYFHKVLGGSQTTAYAVAVGGALGYFASLILHELGHALAARRLGIPIAGIDLWFFGGLSQMRREPQSAGEELKVAAAGPAVTLALFALCLGAGSLIASGSHLTDVALTRQGFTTTPALALVGWLAFINGVLLLFNIVPAFPLDGGRIARAADLVAHRRSQPGDAPDRTLRTGLRGAARHRSPSGPSPPAARRSPCSRCCSPSSSTRPPEGQSFRAHSGVASRTSPSQTSWTASPSRSPPS